MEGCNKKRKKNIIWALLSTVLAVLTVHYILKQNKDMSLGDLMDVIRSSKTIYLLLGALASALFVWFESVALQTILKYTKCPHGGWQTLLYSASDIYFSGITPSATGGQPASAFFMMRNGISGGMATAVLILNLMMYTFSIVFLGIGSILLKPNAFLEFGLAAKILIGMGFVGLTLLSVIFFILLKKEDLIFRPLSALIVFLCHKKLLKGKEHKLKRIAKIREDYARCSALISGRKRILLGAFFWNLVQRACQMTVPMLVYVALGGQVGRMLLVYAKQCLVTIGYNFIPVPGGMGIADYLMVDGFSGMMGEQMAYNVELISRGLMFYICVAASGVLTLIGYFWRGQLQKK
ncbi:MAG: flippase-like domain-containing protein [Bacteroidales bacterium]|nr:flippase-like domain-containing protein [Bacteroidales bacterium]MBR4608543.1 flippase-like domain-containing protein [Lachnospiraceae bacterium]